MDWTSQDDIEGECAPTQLVPASQACDLAEESALEFNPDQSQDAWGAPESLDAWSAPSPVSPPREAARSPPRAEGWSPLAHAQRMLWSHRQHDVGDGRAREVHAMQEVRHLRPSRKGNT